MLASVLGCSACGEELSFTLGALVLGFGNGGDELSFTLGALVLGFGNGGDASLGARLLFMWSRVVIYP